MLKPLEDGEEKLGGFWLQLSQFFFIVAKRDLLP